MNNVVNMEGAIKQDGSAVVAAPNYSDVPVRTTCPQCRKVVMSQVTETIGLACKDKEHRCPNCSNVLGVKKVVG
ncbi:unnamed protein product [Rotaria socialis]